MEINNLQELYTFCTNNNFLVTTSSVAKRGTCGCNNNLRENLGIFRIKSGLVNACIYLHLYLEEPVEIESAKFYNESSNGITISNDVNKFLTFFNSKLSIIKEVNNIT